MLFIAPESHPEKAKLDIRDGPVDYCWEWPGLRVF